MSDEDGSQFCARCQTILPDGAAACPNCGAPLSTATQGAAQFFTRPRVSSSARSAPVSHGTDAEAEALPPHFSAPAENDVLRAPPATPAGGAGSAADAPALTLCWFCGTRPAEPRYELHRDVRRGYTVQSGRLGGRVRYQQLLVPLPRCPACRGAHVWAHRWAMVGLWLGMLFGTLAALVLILVSRSPAVMLLGLAALPAGMVAGAWLGRRLYELRAASRGAGRWRRGDSYPAVAAQIARGWRSGKPFLVSK